MDSFEAFCLLAALGYLWWQLTNVKRRVRLLEEQLAAKDAVRAQHAPAEATRQPQPQPVPATLEPIAPLPAAAVPVPVPVTPLPAAPLPVTPATPAAPVPAPTTARAPAVPRVAPTPSSPPQWQVAFFDLLRKNLFAVAGIVLLLLGFVVLFRSIEWGHLLSPLAKVSLGWVAAAALGFAGIRLSARNGLWGQVVQGGAAAIGFLATYVGASGYEVISPTIALVLFTAISGALVYRALKEDAKVLAGVGFLGAYAAPLLAMYGHAGLLFNLGYGLIVTAFALWVSLSRRWQEIGIHAHVCATGLASLAYAGANLEPALPAWQQQALLLAYVAQFAGWALVWAQRHSPAELARGDVSSAPAREIPILSACFSTTSVVFLALESWLLAPTAFLVVAFVMAAVLAFIGLRVFRQRALRETAWVLSALSVATGLVQGDLARSVASFGLFAEGAILMLTTRAQSIVRRVVAPLLYGVGAVAVIDVPAMWPVALLLVASLAMSLRMQREGWAVEAALAAAVTVAAAAAFSYRYAGLDFRLLPVFTLIMLGATTLAHGMVRSWAASGPAAASTSETSATNAGAPKGPAVRFVPTIYSAALVLGWLLTLTVAREAPMALALGALVTPVVFGAVVAWRSLRRTLSPGEAERAKALLWLAHLLPALVAFILDDSWTLVALLAVAGTAAFAHVLTRLRVDAPSAKASYLTPHSVAFAALLGSPIPLVLATWTDVGTNRVEWVMAAAAFYAALATWWKLGEGVPAQVRSVAASAAGVAMGYVIVRGLTDSPPYAFELAWRSYLLPVALAAVGVAFLFLSTRGGHRLAWQVSAVVLAGSAVKLLLSLGSLALSPMGIVGSLLGMGALFLMAGYLAPQPPAKA
ncbi:DUF2339 domain-containing protein [Mitsuaria sp. 7]|uniref:DUF2339 domain-containing protein n=1 Tax=Mitsuaria sp. 7 TaxID=1658665 RepID=UPI0007DCF6A5|nr:DUF2339 domain-containing protein [Mitsuaria sp. 7]ANH68639.1 hypothetical protein ABE85_15595 [Mitsuaria sp. 7]